MTSGLSCCGGFGFPPLGEEPSPGYAWGVWCLPRSGSGRLRVLAGTLCLSWVGLPDLVGDEPRSLYDICYGWQADPGRAQEYKEEVVRVLGRHMRDRLRVVRSDGSYGLVYDRNGDAASTGSVALYHTKLLQAEGLHPASPVISQDWSAPLPSLRQAEAPPSSAPSQNPPPPDVQLRVDRFLQEQRRKGRLSLDERTSWSVYDLDLDEKLVGIQDETPLQAASLIKPAFALAYFHRVAEGKLSYGPVGRRKLEAMIQHSNNRATNWVLRQLGGPAAVQELLAGHYAHLLPGIRVVEYIPWGGRTYRNTASAGDYVRLLRALWRDELPGSREIKRLMALPNPDRLLAGSRVIPPDTRIYDKTGSTKHLCGNMGILEVAGADGRRHAYAIVGVIEKRRPATHYGSWIRSRGRLIRDVSDIVYQGVTLRSRFQTAGVAAGG